MDPRERDYWRKAHYDFIPGDEPPKKRRVHPDDFPWWAWLVTGLISGGCVTMMVLLLQGRAVL